MPLVHRAAGSLSTKPVETNRTGAISAFLLNFLGVISLSNGRAKRYADLNAAIFQGYLQGKYKFEAADHKKFAMQCQIDSETQIQHWIPA